MKFLCDVHISYKIVNRLKTLRFEATHVNEILDKWFTKDGDICQYADKHDLILISKNADFKNSFLISHTPKKLIKINLDNIPNVTLIERIVHYLPTIQNLNEKGSFLIELDQDSATFI